MSNLIGYHFVDNQYTDAQIAKHMDLLRATKPAWINVLGAAQYEQALNFAKLVRRDIPETRVMFRHARDGGDDGIHTRLSAYDWWEKIGKLYIGSDLTIVTDNESMAADLTLYAKWQAEVMEYAAVAKVSLAVGRFSTHNPPKAQWIQLDRMWRALDLYFNLHYWSPNIYFSDNNFDGLTHIFGGWQRCADLTIKSPRTVIGEYAYAQNLDPHHGYIAANLDGSEYVQRLLTRGAPLWTAEIPACVYAVGDWPIGANTFGLNDAALKALRDRATKPPIPTTYPILPPLTDSRWKPATIKTIDDGVLMRGQPVVASNNVVSRQLKGTHLVYFIDGLVYDKWRGVKFAGFVGWIHSDYFTVVTAPTVPPPTPVDPVNRQQVQAMIDEAVKKAIENFRAELIGALTVEVKEVKQEKIA